MAENITPHNPELRPQYPEGTKYTFQRSFLTGYESYSRAIRRPLSSRIYGSRGEAFFFIALSLYGAYSLRRYARFQRSARGQVENPHKFEVVERAGEWSSLEGLGARMPLELKHL